MSSPIKASSLHNLGVDQGNVHFQVEGADRETVIPANSPAGQALEAFYLAALKELMVRQEQLGQHLSKAANEKLAREAATQAVHSGTPLVSPSTGAPSSSGSSWLRERFARIFGIFGRDKKGPEVVVAAPTAAAPAHGPDGAPPPFIGRLPETVRMSPSEKVPVLSGKDAPAPGLFRPTPTPPPAAPAVAPASSSPAPAAPAAAETPKASSPDISEVFADETGITVTFGTGANAVSMKYPPEHELSRLLLVAYEKLIEAKVPVANVREIAAAWDAKTVSANAPAPAAVAHEAAPAAAADPSEPPPDADDIAQEMPGVFPEESFENLPPAGAPAAPAAEAAASTVIAQPPEPTPQSPVAAAPVAAEPAPAPAPAPASEAPSAPAPEDAPAGDIAALASFAQTAPLEVSVINEGGSKATIAMWQRDGSPILLNKLDDLDTQDLRDAILRKDGPRVTHMLRGQPTPDGRENFTLYFDRNLNEGVSFSDYQKGRSAPAPASVAPTAPVAPTSPAAPAPAPAQPAAAAPGEADDLPMAPTTLVPGSKPISKGVEGP